MPLNKLDRDTIDCTINPLFAELLKLPEKAAVDALNTLSALQVMSQEADHYPELPALFQGAVYQGKEVKDALRLLAEIMHNRQPQKVGKYHDDLSPDVNHGKFALRTEDVTAGEVHDYLRQQFAITKLAVVAYKEVLLIVNEQKAANKSLYYKHFMQWIQQPSGEKIPQDFLSEDAIKKKITSLVDMEEKESKYSESQSTAKQWSDEEIQKCTSHLFSLLSPEMFDAEMASAFHAVFFGHVLLNLKHTSLEVLKRNPDYKAVQEKLRVQIQEGKEDFSCLETVLKSFVEIAKTKEVLDKLGSLIKINCQQLGAEVESICSEYVSCLKNSKSASEQKPLEDKQLNKLQEFLSIAESEAEFLKYADSFFAIYFAENLVEKDKLLARVFYFTFTKKTLCIDNKWLGQTLFQNLKEGVIELTPGIVNVILLHALMTPVESWAPLYYNVFSSALDLLSNPNHPEAIRLDLRRSSYPKKFRKQLNWLAERYVSNRDRTNIPAQPPTVFPMLSYINHPADYIPVLYAAKLSEQKEIFENLNNKLLQMISTEDGFCDVIFSLNIEELKAFYELFKDQLPQIINTFRSVEWIRNLEKDEFQVLYECIKDRLSEAIESVGDFSHVVNYLPVEQRTRFLKSHKDKLLKLVETAPNFTLLASYLQPGEQIELCEIFKDKLPELIKTLKDFEWVVSANFGTLRAVIERVKDKLQGLVKTAADFSMLLCKLSPYYFAIVYEAIKNKLPEIIQTPNDFQVATRDLQADQRKVIVDDVKGRLPGLVETVPDFNLYENLKNQLLECIAALPEDEKVYENDEDKSSEVVRTAAGFNPSDANSVNPVNIQNQQANYPVQGGAAALINDQRAAAGLAAAMPSTVAWAACDSEQKYPQSRFIETVDDFQKVASCISSERRTILLEDVKDKLPELIKTLEDFLRVIHYLSDDQCKTVSMRVKDKLPGFIKTAEDFSNLLGKLPFNKYVIVCEIIKHQIIKTAKNFHLIAMCHSRDHAKHIVMFNCLKDMLSGCIGTADDFNLVICDLKPDQRSEAYESVKDKLPELIKTAGDFSRVIYWPELNQRREVYESVKDKLSGFIRTPDDFNHVIKHLEPNQRRKVYESVKDKLLGFIRTPDDFNHVTLELDFNQRREVYKSFKDKFSGIIGTVVDFNKATRELDFIQRIEVYERVKGKLLGLIGTAAGFNNMISGLETEQRVEVYESLKDKLSGFIKTVDNFNDVMRWLGPNQRREVYESVKDRLSGIIGSTVDFNYVIRELEPNQCKEVCESVKDRFSQIVRGSDDLFRMISGLSSEQRKAVGRGFKDALLKFIKTIDNKNGAYVRVLQEVTKMIADESSDANSVNSVNIQSQQANYPAPAAALINDQRAAAGLAAPMPSAVARAADDSERKYPELKY